MMYDRIKFSYQIWKCKAEGQFICACSVNFSLMRETAGSISWRAKRPKTVVNHDLINPPRPSENEFAEGCSKGNSILKLEHFLKPCVTTIEWFSKRTGTSVDNSARSKNTVKKLGRECRPVVSQK